MRLTIPESISRPFFEPLLPRTSEIKDAILSLLKIMGRLIFKNKTPLAIKKREEKSIIFRLIQQNRGRRCFSLFDLSLELLHQIKTALERCKIKLHFHRCPVFF